MPSFISVLNAYGNASITSSDSDIIVFRKQLVEAGVHRNEWPLWVTSKEYRESAVELVEEFTSFNDTRVLNEALKKQTNECIANLGISNSRALKKARHIIEKIIKLPVGKMVDGVMLNESCFALVLDKKDPKTWKGQILTESGAFIETNVMDILPKVDSEHITVVKERYINAKLKSNAKNGSRVLLSGFSKLTEGKHDDDHKSKGRLKITVIQPGLTLDEQKFYPREVLAEAVGLYDGVKMFANHPTFTEEIERPERDINHFVAVVENVHLGAGGEILADAVVIDPEFKDKLELMNSQGKLSEMGISQNAIGDFEFEEINGREVMVIKQILAVRSVDFVTQGNAGGATHILEALEHDVDLMSADRLVECRPDLIIKLKEKWNKEREESQMNWEEEFKKLKEKLANLEESNSKEQDELKAQLKEALTKIAEIEGSEAKNKTQTEISALIKEAKLPDEVKTHLTESFVDEDNFETAKPKVEKQIEIMESLNKGAKVKDMGRSEENDDNNEEEDTEVLIESYAITFERQGNSKDKSREMAEAKFNASV